RLILRSGQRKQAHDEAKQRCGEHSGCTADQYAFRHGHDSGRLAPIEIDRNRPRCNCPTTEQLVKDRYETQHAESKADKDRGLELLADSSTASDFSYLGCGRFIFTSFKGS